jgi:excisionase family DNA binding protein
MTSQIERLTSSLQDALATRVLLTVGVKDAARALNLSERSIWKLIKAGRLRSTKLGKRRLVNFSDVQRLVDFKEE